MHDEKTRSFLSCVVGLIVADADWSSADNKRRLAENRRRVRQRDAQSDQLSVAARPAAKRSVAHEKTQTKGGISNQTSTANVGVTYQRILQASEDPGNWLTYSGQYSGQRFSRLNQINNKNVKKLRVKWVRQYNILEALETSPLVVDGMMYATLPDNGVEVLDAKTGCRTGASSIPCPTNSRCVAVTAIGAWPSMATRCI